MKHDIIIVGGGASGIIAAIAAKDSGSDAAIIEGNNRIGRKILSTGNGRCNISNININLSRYHSSNGSFYGSVLARFGYKETENFFSSLGLPLSVLEDGKVYPMSLQASSVIDILRFALSERNIPVYTSSKVKTIIQKKDSFIIKVQYKPNNNLKANSMQDSHKEFANEAQTPDAPIEEFECNKLILACGGNSAPKTGSDGSGYNLAASLGHKLITPYPALVQIKLDYNHLKALSGIKFIGSAEIREYADKDTSDSNLKANSNLESSYFKNPCIPSDSDYVVLKKQDGEILFTDYGTSGPPILQLSRTVSEYFRKNKSFNSLKHNKRLAISVDMMPEYNLHELMNFMQNHFALVAERSIYDSLVGIINKKIIPILLKEAEIDDIHKPCSYLSWKEKSRICSLIKGWTFNITGTNSFSDSQVTDGGIDTKDINSNDLSSKLVHNLYFAGEILDVDGDCGGFNLQWAWASGYICGKSCAEKSNV